MPDKSWDIENALAMVAGHDMDALRNQQVTDEDKQLIRDALENIFQGSSVILWTDGGTLQNAWTTALDNMRDEFFATRRRDAVTIFLQRAIFEHREGWTRKILTNDNRLQTVSGLGLTSEQMTELLKHAKFQRQQGYDVIKKIIEKYDSGFKPDAKYTTNPTQEFNIERTRENEHTHEHIK